MLGSLTLFLNYIFLVAAIWLGIYLVTRSPRSNLAWLTGLTMWSIAGLFLNSLLALVPPPIDTDSLGWLQWAIPFWPRYPLADGKIIWLRGWLVIPAVAFWHHATILMRPGKLNAWRLARVFLVYAVAVSTIVVHLNTSLLFSSTSGSPLYLNTLKPGTLYPPVMALLFLFTGMCLFNLVVSARYAPGMMARMQLILLIAATLIAGFTGPLSFITTAVEWNIPRVILSIFLGSAVVLIGYSVAQYSALTEGRTIRRDFVFSALSVGFVLLIYMLVTWAGVQLFKVPPVAYIIVSLLAVSSHSVIDIARRRLDSSTYLQENLNLRDSLRSLMGKLDSGKLEENLAVALEMICVSVRATYALFFYLRKMVSS